MGMVIGTTVCGLVLSESDRTLNFSLEKLNSIYICLAALGMLISTYLCVQDELNKGCLNVVTVINDDSDYF
jgi:hypothetical protein